MVKRLFALLTVSVSLIATLPAQASLIYDVATFTFGSHIPFEYSFTEPNFLTITTTIPAADITIITSPGCSINSVTITDPFSASPTIGESLGSPCSSSSTLFNLVGPFDHVGSYSNGALLPTILTISGTPVPEPSALLLLGSGMLGVLGTIRKKLL